MPATVVVGGDLDSIVAEQVHRRHPHGKVLLDDPNFDNGLRGWRRLSEPLTAGDPSTVSAKGIVQLADHPSSDGLSACLSTENFVAGTVSEVQRDCAAFKRLNVVEAGQFAFHYKIAWKTKYGQNGLRAIEIDLDDGGIVGSGGARALSKLRWAHYAANRDGTGSWTRQNKWQIIDADGLPTDIPGGAYVWPYNENKGQLIDIVAQFDYTNPAAPKYDGLMFGDKVIGNIDGIQSGDNTLRNLGAPPPTALTTFETGWNAGVENRGPVHTAASEADVFIARAKGWVV